MATFKVTINTDNDAFVDMPKHEIARILIDVAARVERNGIGYVYRATDINGNTVGKAELVAEDED